MEISQIIPHVEALIFAADRPLPAMEIVELLNNALAFLEDRATLDQVSAALEAIHEKYQSEFYAFEVRESGGGFQFLTKKDYYQTVAQLNGEKFLKRLSTAALETLAIIAYRQPISKGEIEHIRGVSTDYSIQKLLEKELIVISGRSEDLPGKPLLYATSKSFMDYFGLNSPADLPKLREVFDEEIIQPTLISDELLQAQEHERERPLAAPGNGNLIVSESGELVEQADKDSGEEILEDIAYSDIPPQQITEIVQLPPLEDLQQVVEQEEAEAEKEREDQDEEAIETVFLNLDVPATDEGQTTTATDTETLEGEEQAPAGTEEDDLSGNPPEDTLSTPEENIKDNETPEVTAGAEEAAESDSDEAATDDAADEEEDVEDEEDEEEDVEDEEENEEEGNGEDGDDEEEDGDEEEEEEEEEEDEDSDDNDEEEEEDGEDDGEEDEEDEEDEEYEEEEEDDDDEEDEDSDDDDEEEEDGEDDGEEDEEDEDSNSEEEYEDDEEEEEDNEDNGEDGDNDDEEEEGDDEEEDDDIEEEEEEEEEEDDDDEEEEEDDEDNDDDKKDNKR
ncbi:SMC-Scp complex subunit ScpB [Chitinophaga pendula]|uniref:SMC-Scp complex subunit ScpB n=1 Tax=Chitinophaga pendula TaxID=2849666 RepID=UPI001CED1235|nr:SMC-Scp complex subunit ScpB [Chitinophaga pendula]UCJ07305.1 SMC-Scp complex subunit ScpB [Chitinophaga pendula]